MSSKKSTNTNNQFGSKSKPRSTTGPKPTRPECQAINDGGVVCGETSTLSITDELKELYESRLHRLDEELGGDAAGDSDQLQLKVKVLQSWVHDLIEQNAELVHTVEELEQEMAHRVTLLDEKLKVSSRTARDYMTKMQDFNGQMQELEAEKASKDDIILQLQAELRALQQTETIKSSGEIATLKKELSLKESQIKKLIQRIQDLRDDIQKNAVAVSNLFKGNVIGKEGVKVTDLVSTVDSSESRHLDSDAATRQENAAASYSEVLRAQSELQKVEGINVSNVNNNLILAKQLQEAELISELTLLEKQRLTDDLIMQDKQLVAKDQEIIVLVKTVTNMDKAARDMQAALTSEVAEKHDLIGMLRQDVYELEDRCRQADMQTHFKDDIIKEMRKEIKLVRSKVARLEQEITEKNVNADRGRKFSSSPQLGSNLQAHQYFTEDPSQSCLYHNQNTLEQIPPTTQYQDPTRPDQMRHNGTQCEFPEKQVKTRTKSTKFQQSNAAEHTPCSGQYYGDASDHRPVLIGEKEYCYQRTRLPPSKDDRTMSHSQNSHNVAASNAQVRENVNEHHGMSKNQQTHQPTAWDRRGK